MHAHSTVVAEVRGGRTQCATLRSDPPFTWRETGVGELHLVASAGGPLGGDDLRLDLSVGEGAALVVRSVGATVVQPGALPHASTATITVAVGRAATLRWNLEPTVLVRGCDHHVDISISLAPDASLVWCELLALGRWNEEPGSAFVRLRVDRAGAALVRTDLAVGPRFPASTGPAVLAGATAVATVIAVGASRPRLPSIDEPELRAEVFQLADDVHLGSAIATNARLLRELCADLMGPRRSGVDTR